VRHHSYNENLPGKILYLFSILLSLLMILKVFSGLNEQQIYVYFNSDTLYLPSIFRDLFVDHSGFSGWHLNGAPNFFPDMLLYFIINTVFFNFRVAMIIFSILQYGILLILIRRLFRTIFPGIREEELAAGNLIMLVFFLVTLYPGDFVFTFYLLSISYHMGAFLMALLAMVFTFRFLKSGHRSDLFFLFLTGLSGVINDKLFIAMYVLPALSLILFLPSVNYRKRIILVLSNTLLVVLLGTIIYNGIRHSGTIHIISLSWKFLNFANIPVSFHTMIHQHLTYIKSLDFRSLTVILSILSFLVTTWFAVIYFVRFYRNKNVDVRDLFTAIYLVFSAFFWIIVLATPVINGSYVGYAILRYNIYAFYLSLFNLSVILMLIRRNMKLRHTGWIISGSLTLLLILPLAVRHSGISSGGLKNLVHYYPAMVRKMDTLSSREDLHYGVASYWNAKYITMFSQTGLRVYTVYEDLNPWYHVMNENWYHRGGKGKYGNPAFTFVYMEALDSARVAQKLGNPLKVIPFRESSVHVYQPFYFDDRGKPVLINAP